MDRRIKKKFENRLGCRKYADYRIRLICKLASDKGIGENDLLHIVTCKHNKNNKHIHSVSMFKDVYPTVCAPTNDTQGIAMCCDTTQITTINPNGAIANMLEAWKAGIMKENEHE